MSTSDLSSPKDSKTAIACNRCKASKVKCGGVPGKACPGCRKAGMTCTYRPSGPKVYVRISYIQGLKARIRELETKVQELELELALSDFNADPVVVEDEVLPDDFNSMFDGMENLFLSPSGDQESPEHFVRKGTTTAWTFSLNREAENLSREVDPQDKDPSWVRRSPSPSYMPLPPPEVARHFYKSQHDYIGTIFSFVQRNDFDARLEEFYQNPLPNSSSQESCLKYCQVMLVCAYGELYSVNQWTLEGPPGLKFFKQAIRYLPSGHEAGSVLFVEVLGLVGYYFQVLNRRDAAFLYIGMALRMATSLGLHQELGENGNTSPVEREHRRRVWWSVYSMDRIISVKWGNPLTIHDEDIGVAEPTYRQELDGDTSSANVLACYSRLSMILGKIGEEIYRRKHTDSKTLLTAIKAMMKKLSSWSRDLPQELCIDPNTLGFYVSREAVSTHLHYYQCVHMTARPLLFSVTQKRLEAIRNRTATSDWKTGLPSSVTSIIEHAIDGARLSTQITSAALDKNLVATYGFMDGEHAFSSALTLVMANIALDNNEVNALAMKTAMNVLQSMAQRGNSYVAYRHTLLQNLRATIPNKEDSAIQPPVFRNPEFGIPLAIQAGGESNNGLATKTTDVPGNVIENNNVNNNNNNNNDNNGNNTTFFPFHLPITRPIPGQYPGSMATAPAPASTSTSNNLSPFGIISGDSRRQDVLPNIFDLTDYIEDVDQEPPFNFYAGECINPDYLDVQKWIGNAHHLQQQIHE